MGAGPAGLLLALLLSQEGISVEVVEADKDVDRRPRAAYYGTASIPDLERAGVLHDVRRAGFPPTSFTQRLFGGDYRVLGLLDTNIISDVDGKDLRSACLPQQDLLELLLEHLKDDRRKALVTLSWGHKVVGLGQERDTAWVDVVAADDGSKEKRIQADYVVGCDGARSTVRKNLFGEEFPGKTWDFQLVSTDVGTPHNVLPVHMEMLLLTTDGHRLRQTTTSAESSASQTRISSPIPPTFLLATSLISMSRSVHAWS